MSALEPGAASRVPLVLGLLAVGGVLLTSLVPGYGLFIDEHYYVACSKRLAAGYVDHPPLAPWLLRLSRELLGDGRLALRLPPALALGASVVLAGRLARGLGAGPFGQALAALALACAPIPLCFAGFFSVNAFEVLLWTAATWALVEQARTGLARWWIAFGAFAGLALLDKHTFVLLGLALLLGLLATPARRALARPAPWIAAALALALAAPNLAWQLAHGWPSLEFYRNADLGKSIPTPPQEVLLQQILFFNPAGALVWGAGLGFFLFAARGRPWRHLGLAFAVLLVLICTSGRSRPDRIAGAYPLALAGGAVLWERWSAGRPWRWLRVALPAALLACLAVLLPIALPTLPPEQLARWSATLGVVPEIEQGQSGALPQWLADRFGWEAFVDEVQRVVEDELSPEERARCLILAPSYGHAGALELLGRGRDLPPVVGVQNSCHTWGPGDAPDDVLIAIGFGPDVLSQLYDEVEQVGETRCRWCPSGRSGIPIFVARGRKVHLRDVWERFRAYG